MPSPNGNGAVAAEATPPTWPFDAAGLHRTVEAAAARLWDKEEERRASAGPPLHVQGAVVVALLMDDHGKLAVGLGTDYPGAPAGDPTALIGIVGRHLAALADDAMKKKPREDRPT